MIGCRAKVCAGPRKSNNLVIDTKQACAVVAYKFRTVNKEGDRAGCMIFSFQFVTEAFVQAKAPKLLWAGPGTTQAASEISRYFHEEQNTVIYVPPKIVLLAFPRQIGRSSKPNCPARL